MKDRDKKHKQIAMCLNTPSAQSIKPPFTAGLVDNSVGRNEGVSALLLCANTADRKGGRERRLPHRARYGGGVPFDAFRHA